MTILHHVAQAAAVILLIELLVVLLLFLGVAGGLAFGLHWVRGKTDWAFDKANGYLSLVPKYTHTGTGLVAKPFILGGGVGTRLLVTLDAVRRQIRENRKHTASSVPGIVGARPVDIEETTTVPFVADTTEVLPIVPDSASRV